MRIQLAICLPLLSPTACAAVQADGSDFVRIYGEADDALLAGEASKAVGVLEDAVKRWPDHPTLSYALACAHARAGDDRSSEQWLRAALSAGYSEAALIRWDQDLGSLRKSGRLEEILEEVNLVDKNWSTLVTVFPDSLDPETDIPQAVASTPDVSVVVVGYKGGGVELLNGSNGALLLEFSPFDHDVLALDVSPDGSRLAILCEDGQVGMWSLPKGALIKIQQALHPSPTPAENFRAMSPGAELPSDEHLAYFDFAKPWRSSVEFDPGGMHVVIRSVDQGMILMSAKAAILKTWIESERPGYSVTEWSPDGGTLVMATENEVRFIRPDDLEAASPVLKVESPVRALSFHPDGRLGTGHQDGHIHVWNIEDLSLIKSTLITQEDLVGKDPPFPVDSIPISEICYSPTGEKLAVATVWEDHIIVLDEPSMSPMFGKWKRPHRSAIPHDLAWSSDGVILWFGFRDRADLRAVEPVDGAEEVFVAFYGSVPPAAAIARSSRGRLASIVNLAEVAMFDAVSGEAFWVRAGRFGGEHIVHTSGGYFGSSTPLSEVWQVHRQWGGVPESLADEVAELFDPKRVRAAAAGVRIRSR